MKRPQKNNHIRDFFINTSLLSHVMREPFFSICENKDADQLHGDQRLCFRYTDSTVHLLPKSEFPPVAVQPGLCWTWSKTPRPVFSGQGSNVKFFLHQPSVASAPIPMSCGLQCCKISIFSDTNKSAIINLQFDYRGFRYITVYL